ncbi:hypothetical protein SAMN05428978_101222 [Nitrosomonas sp. Nm34]|nr:hypothetical protein SAMN05428978_101222 [Nitrosomonas sp. Nm34]
MRRIKKIRPTRYYSALHQVGYTANALQNTCPTPAAALSSRRAAVESVRAGVAAGSD